MAPSLIRLRYSYFRQLHGAPDPCSTQSMARIQTTVSVKPTTHAMVPSYSCSAVRWTPQQWRDAGQQSAVGTHDWSGFPTLTANWDRAGGANGGLELTQVDRGNSVVGWYWRCPENHLWREPLNRMFTRNMYGSHARWRQLAGSIAACRRCVLDQFGARFDRCGCISHDLLLVALTPRVLRGHCPECTLLGSRPKTLGQPVLVQYTPPTSKQENILRGHLAKLIPLASRYEVNAVNVDVTSWGARHVFPDMLIPTSRIAVEYDSPGPLHDAHGPLSVDLEKDGALRRVGWEVIRVRVGGLPLIGPYDVPATGPTQSTAAAVVGQYNRVLLERPQAAGPSPLIRGCAQ